MGRLTPEQQDLAVKYLGLASYLAGNYARRNRVDVRDLLDVAYEAITKAALKSDPDRGAEQSFFSARINFELRDYFRDDRRNLLRDAYPIEECDLIRGRDVARSRVVEVLARLSRHDRRSARILRLRYLRGIHDAEIGRRLGLSQQSIYKIRKKAFDFLRNDAR